MSAMSDALNRLLTGYYNSNPVDAITNPGGLANDGHEINFPAALADLGLVTQYLSLFDAAGISGQASALAPNFRNLVTNGAFALDQRNAFAAVAVAAATTRKYVCDRWAVTTPTTGALTAQVAAIDWSAIGVYAKNALKLTVTTAQAVVAAGDLSYVTHRIEGGRIARLKWGGANARPIMASLGLQMPITGVYGISVANAAGSRSLVHMVNLVANTPTLVSFGIAGETGGVWNTDTSLGLDVRINLMCGANGQAAAADVWNVTDKQSLNTQANLFATNGNVGWISELQLEAGNVKSPFESRPDEVELRMCKRFFEKSFPAGTAPVNNSAAFRYVAQAFQASFASTALLFEVEKRGTPTITLYSGNNIGAPTNGMWNVLDTAWVDGASDSIVGASTTGFSFQGGRATGTFTAVGAYIVSGNWTADSEF